MDYTVKIEVFEGPFDLLFHLIEKQEMDIYDIPISQITDQYLEYIYKLNMIDLEPASEFLVMAATLLEIKSKMLLPNPKIDKSNVEDTENDPRQELVEKLLEYKTFKRIAAYLKKLHEKRKHYYSKQPEDLYIYAKEKANPLGDVSIKDLIKAFISIQKKETVNQSIIQTVYKDKVSVEMKIKEIATIVKEKKKVSFKTLIKTSRKSTIVFTFLGLLELIRLKKVFVCQNSLFDDMLIYDMDYYKHQNILGA
ncbi:MAG: segregation and condensation protein [Thermosediminibacterales bacterium]|nr:segregation and condensation protein [Thermosediminibacterales bacterium]